MYLQYGHSTARLHKTDTFMYWPVIPSGRRCLVTFTFSIKHPTSQRWVFQPSSLVIISILKQDQHDLFEETFEVNIGAFQLS